MLGKVSHQQGSKRELELCLYTKAMFMAHLRVCLGKTFPTPNRRKPFPSGSSVLSHTFPAMPRMGLFKVLGVNRLQTGTQEHIKMR